MLPKQMALKAFFLSLSVAIMATSFADAQNPIGMVHLNGTLYCTPNGAANGPSTPVFLGATVQVECQPSNLVATSSVTTNAAGRYDVTVVPGRTTPNQILSSRRVAVNTPLSKCKANLPSAGCLVSSLQFVKTVPAGFWRLTYLIATGFQLV